MSIKSFLRTLKTWLTDRETTIQVNVRKSESLSLLVFYLFPKTVYKNMYCELLKERRCSIIACDTFVYNLYCFKCQTGRN